MNKVEAPKHIEYVSRKRETKKKRHRVRKISICPN